MLDYYNQIDYRPFRFLIAAMSVGVACFIQCSGLWAEGMVFHAILCMLALVALVFWKPDTLFTIDPYVILSFVLWISIGFYKHFMGMDGTQAAPVILCLASEISLFSLAFTLIGMCLKVKPIRLAFIKEQTASSISIAGIACLLISAPACLLRTSGKELGGMLTFAIPGIVPALALFASKLLLKVHWTTVSLLILSLAVICIDSSRRSFVTAACILFSFGLTHYRRALRKPLPRTFLLVCLLIGFVIYLAAAARRSIEWSEGTMHGFVQDYKENAGEARNLSTIPDLALAIEYYTDSKSKLKGSTIVNWIFNPIPRAFWENKPIAMSKALAFAKMGYHGEIQYSRELDESINNQSYSATFAGEMWANLGWLGVCIGSLVLGFSYNFVYAHTQSDVSGFFAPAIFGALLSAILIQNRGDILAANFFPECAILYSFLSLGAIAFLRRLRLKRLI